MAVCFDGKMYEKSYIERIGDEYATPLETHPLESSG
jgi:hypothetical protein